MLKHLLAGTVAALALAVPAHAAPVYDCNLVAARTDDVAAIGSSYLGVAYGYVVDPGGDGRIRCYVTVDGAEVAGTTYGANGPGHAITYGVVGFDATDDQEVLVCAEVNGVPAECWATDHQQVPPQEVIDALDSAGQAVDSVVCQPLRAIGGAGFNVLGRVVIDAQGDVYVNGTRTYDCPPYA